MPYRRRHDGLTPNERHDELNLWQTILSLLTFCTVLPVGAMRDVFLRIVTHLIQGAINLRQLAWDVLDPINTAHRNRGFNSFTREESYRHLRFNHEDLPTMMEKLGFPIVFKTDAGNTCSGEYAMLLLLYRLHYPSTLAGLQKTFGRDYTQLSRIFQASITLVYSLHHGKVNGNIVWYRDRFDNYNEAICTIIGKLPNNPVPGTVPIQLNDIFGFMDGTALEICRPHVSFFVLHGTAANL